MKTQFPDENGDEKIGYKSPPKEFQFKKGRSGNPNGRPKAQKNKTRKEMLDELLDVEIRVGDQMMTKRKAFWLALINDSLKSKASARVMLLALMDDDDSNVENFDPSLDDQIEWIKTVRRKSGPGKDENVGRKKDAS